MSGPVRPSASHSSPVAATSGANSPAQGLVELIDAASLLGAPAVVVAREVFDHSSGCNDVVIRGHAFVQNVRRGHYQFDCDADSTTRLEAAFEELRAALDH